MRGILRGRVGERGDLNEASLVGTSATFRMGALIVVLTIGLWALYAALNLDPMTLYGIWGFIGIAFLIWLERQE